MEVQVLFRPPTTHKMTLADFFSKDYLLDPNTPGESRLYIPLTVLFGTLVIFSVITKFIRSSDIIKIAERYFISFLTIGILGFFYLFFRYEELPYLSARIILLLILVSLFVWESINVIWTIKSIPEYKKEKETEARYQKYLPKNKQVSNKRISK